MRPNLRPIALALTIALLLPAVPARAGAEVLRDDFEGGLASWTFVTTGAGVAEAAPGAARDGAAGLLLRGGPDADAWAEHELGVRLRSVVAALDLRRERPAAQPLVALRDAGKPRLTLVTDRRGELRLVAAGGARTRSLGRLRLERWTRVTVMAEPARRRVGIRIGARKPVWARLRTGPVDALRIGGPVRERAEIAADDLVVRGVPIPAASPTPTPAPTATPGPSGRLRFEGKGSDSGVGMSQTGAIGRAAAGQLHPEILAHYYPGTTLETRPNERTVRILVLDDAPVSPADPVLVCGRVGTWTIDGADIDFPAGACARFVNGTPPRVTVVDRDGVELWAADAPDSWVRPVAANTLLALPARNDGDRLRGVLRVLVRPAKVDVVNHVGMESYLRAVVPREMAPQRPTEALRAQAIAARSYAIHQLKGPDRVFDVHDDTRNQVYGGVANEHPLSDAAIADTAGVVVVYGGKVANAIYHAQGGGATEDARYVFNPSDGSVGEDIPYLRGSLDVDPDGDPYDAGGGYDFWRTDAFTLGQLSAWMAKDPRTDVGEIRTLLLDGPNRRGVSGRVWKLTLVGKDGTRRTVSGWYFKSVFNRWTTSDRLLRSTLYFLAEAPR
ncbi:MAG: SpoIID/LytB domain-containing protein [Chloroflexota bacterium]